MNMGTPKPFVKIVTENFESLNKNKIRLEVQLRASLQYSTVKNQLALYIDIVDEIIETLKKEQNANNV